MITVNDWYRELDRLAPFDTAEEWDNAGLLIGSGSAEARRVLFSLDITPAVADEASLLRCQLIISHHPVIFKPLRSLPAEHVAYRLAAAGIAALCAHTNLDIARGGVSDALADKLGLTDLKPLRLLESGASRGLAIGRVGNLPEGISAGELAGLVKQRLSASCVHYVEGKGKITAVAVCGGSGAEYIEDAIRAGAQALVTGEADHHELLLAGELGLTLVNAGHYATEAVILEPLMKYLLGRLPSAEVILSKAGGDCVKIVNRL